MRPDATAGGNVPALDGAAILARAPEVASIAEVEPIDWGMVPASHLTFAQICDIARTVSSALARSDIDGGVIVQGTDTIEETAFFYDLLLDSPKPVVVTGAMRPASDPRSDGPANLRDAVRCAAASALRDAGVVVVLDGTIEAADDVTKTHASADATFRSLNLGTLGRVEGDRVDVVRRRGRRRHVATAWAAERVRLITAHVAMDGALVDAGLAAGTDGIVIEATGAGNTDPSLLAACERAMAGGVPVVLTTRCPAGRASADYAFPGGGATWVRAGAILAGYLGGPKARVALALGLGAGLDRAGLEALFADPEPAPGIA
jgi:L-asparaginase